MQGRAGQRQGSGKYHPRSAGGEGGGGGRSPRRNRGTVHPGLRGGRWKGRSGREGRPELLRREPGALRGSPVCRLCARSSPDSPRKDRQEISAGEPALDKKVA